MKILLIGKSGQVGWELQRSLALLGEVIALDHHDVELCGNLLDLEGIRTTIQQTQPHVIVNAAAYTAVDKAESDRVAAELLNHHAVSVIAQEAARIGALLVHYSTDYVFNGEGEHFRSEEEQYDPLNHYGCTKAAGEQAIKQANPYHLIFRTSWVYAARRHNFIKTMLKLAENRSSLTIIDDQHGAPTGAELLADCTAIAISRTMQDRTLCGTYHLVASGETTWFELAHFIFTYASTQQPSFIPPKLEPIATIDYLTPVKRPLNSRLANDKFQRTFDVHLPDWRLGVQRVITELLTKE